MRITPAKLGLLAFAMFGFGFLLVPIYDVFCKVTGLNGKTDINAYQYNPKTAEVDKSRKIEVQFLTTKNDGMDWYFEPSVYSVKIHPGEIGALNFVAENLTTKRVIGQAIPSVTPSEATNYLHKVECFCFASQVLGPHEKMVMPLRIIVDPNLPKHIKKLTLSYTLFDVTSFEENTRL